MNDLAIRAEDLSKQFRIGAYRGYRTLREQIVERVTSLRRRTRADESTIWALKDVSFEITSGDVVGIIGANGAGKSTLLKILSRITEPTDGRVEIHGRVGSLLEVGTGFHHELTGRENVYLNGAILGMRKSEIERNFDAIVAFSETAKFIDTPVKHYSTGMQMRLAFAVAAHLQPEILIIDEVLAVGDTAFQKKCLGKMREVATAGRTVLFVSHNMGAVANLCTSALWLQEGRVVMRGPAQETIAAYMQTVSDSVSSSSSTWTSHARSPPSSCPSRSSAPRAASWCWTC
jgi:lipopolysaccharide transport system ATP-binding protein